MSSYTTEDELKTHSMRMCELTVQHRFGLKLLAATHSMRMCELTGGGVAV